MNPIAHTHCKLTMHENKYPLKRIAACEKEEGVGWNYQIVDHDRALIALSRTSPL